MTNKILAVSIVVHCHGRFLLVRRGHEPAKGQYAFPGGKVEAGETLIAAAKRELLEETGIQVSRMEPLKCLDIDNVQDMPAYRLHVFYSNELPSREPIPGSDADEAAWFSAQQIERLVAPPSVKAIAKELKQRNEDNIMLDTIHLATHDDLAQVKACVHAAYNHYVEEIGQRPAPLDADYQAILERKQLWCLSHDGKIDALVVLYPNGSNLHVENLAVHPRNQGKGYGQTLLNFCDQFALASGLNGLELYTHVKMTKNIAYYLKLGFIEIKRQKEEGLDRVYFVRELTKQ